MVNTGNTEQLFNYTNTDVNLVEGYEIFSMFSCISSSKDKALKMFFSKSFNRRIPICNSSYHFSDYSRKESCEFLSKDAIPTRSFY